MNFYLNYLVNLRKHILVYDNIVNNVNKFNLNFNNAFLNNSIFSKIIYNFYSSDAFSKKSKILTIMSYKIRFINFEDKSNVN